MDRRECGVCGRQFAVDVTPESMADDRVCLSGIGGPDPTCDTVGLAKAQAEILDLRAFGAWMWGEAERLQELSAALGRGQRGLVESADEEEATLRADNARLTRERDEAQSSLAEALDIVTDVVFDIREIAGSGWSREGCIARAKNALPKLDAIAVTVVGEAARSRVHNAEASAGNLAREAAAIRKERDEALGCAAKAEADLQRERERAEKLKASVDALRSVVERVKMLPGVQTAALAALNIADTLGKDPTHEPG